MGDVKISYIFCQPLITVKHGTIKEKKKTPADSNVIIEHLLAGDKDK